MSAERNRKYRARRKAGRICLPIEVDEVDLVEALVEAGWLSRQDEEDRAAIRAAFERSTIRILKRDASRHGDSNSVMLDSTYLRGPDDED